MRREGGEVKLRCAAQTSPSCVGRSLNVIDESVSAFFLNNSSQAFVLAIYFSCLLFPNLVQSCNRLLILFFVLLHLFTILNDNNL